MLRFRAAVVAPSVLIVAATAVVAGVATPAGARPSSGEVLSAKHAIVTAPSDGVVKQLAPTQGCQVLLDTGKGDCRVVQTAHGDLVVTVEAGPKIQPELVTRPWTVRVYQPSDALPDGWKVALSTTAVDGEQGPEYAQVTAKAADVTADGKDELVIGYRQEGTGEILNYDVIGTDAAGVPSVVAHDVVYKGNVRTRGGHLTEYAPVYKRNDANCCPTYVDTNVVRYQSGKFVVHTVKQVPTKKAKVPPSDIG